MPPTAASVGRSLVDSLEDLFKQDLSTVSIEPVYRDVQDCVTVCGGTMRVYVFGSTAVYGLHEPKSDVDVVVLRRADVADGRGFDDATEAARNSQAGFLRQLASVIRQRRIALYVEEVLHARVPVLRIKLGDGRGDIDITAQRRGGVRNSALLRAYFEQSPESRLLGIVVKRWSKRAGVNSYRREGSISSYGFNLMTVYYLLQKGTLRFVPPSSVDVASVGPMPAYLPLERPRDEGIELGKQVLGFLNFYLHEFDSTRHVISLSREGITTKEQLGWTEEPKGYFRNKYDIIHKHWCIEDPCALNRNVGQLVNLQEHQRLRREMEKALETALLTKM